MPPTPPPTNDDQSLEGESVFLAVMQLFCQVPAAIVVTLVTVPIYATTSGLRRARSIVKGFLFPFRC